MDYGHEKRVSYAKQSEGMKKGLAEIDKALKECDKGITVDLYESGDLKKSTATGEKGSVHYSTKDCILDRPDLLEHGY